MKKKIFSVLIVLITSVLLYAAGTTDYYNQNVNYTNHLRGVTYTGTITFADSAANYHTKAMFIGDGNANDGYISTDVTTGYTAASDFIVKYKFSNDLVTWHEVTDTDVDQDADQVDADTLGVAQGSDDLFFHKFNWLIIEFDGQTANPANSICTWSVSLKPTNLGHVNGQPLLSGKVARASTNP